MASDYLSLVTEFCASIGVACPDSLTSPAELIIDDVRISLFHDQRVADDLLISASICDLPDSNRENVLRAMLAFNFHCSQTAQPVIALGPNGKTIMISFSKALSDLDPDLLRESISYLLEIRNTLELAVQNPGRMQELVYDSDDDEDEIAGKGDIVAIPG